MFTLTQPVCCPFTSLPLGLVLLGHCDPATSFCSLLTLELPLGKNCSPLPGPSPCPASPSPSAPQCGLQFRSRDRPGFQTSGPELEASSPVEQLPSREQSTCGYSLLCKPHPAGSVRVTAPEQPQLEPWNKPIAGISAERCAGASARSWVLASSAPPFYHSTAQLCAAAAAHYADNRRLQAFCWKQRFTVCIPQTSY